MIHAYRRGFSVLAECGLKTAILGFAHSMSIVAFPLL
jgi:hypothetical protein